MYSRRLRFSVMRIMLLHDRGRFGDTCVGSEIFCVASATSASSNIDKIARITQHDT